MDKPWACCKYIGSLNLFGWTQDMLTYQVLTHSHILLFVTIGEGMCVSDSPKICLCPAVVNLWQQMTKQPSLLQTQFLKYPFVVPLIGTRYTEYLKQKCHNKLYLPLKLKVPIRTDMNHPLFSGDSVRMDVRSILVGNHPWWTGGSNIQLLSQHCGDSESTKQCSMRTSTWTLYTCCTL